MELELTAVFRRVPEGYIAFVEELPGANTQGNEVDPIGWTDFGVVLSSTSGLCPTTGWHKLADWSRLKFG